MPETINNQAVALRNDLQNFGLNGDNDKIGQNLREIRSTRFFGVGSQLPTSVKFFTDTNVDGYWTDYTLPQQETAIKVWGIALDYQLNFAATPTAIFGKIQQAFEGSTKLQFKYRRRVGRLFFSAQSLVPYSLATIGNVSATLPKPNSAQQNGYFMLPQSQVVLLAPKIDLSWEMNIQPGFILDAAVITGANATPTLPNSGGLGNYITLRLLIEELFESNS